MSSLTVIILLSCAVMVNAQTESEAIDALKAGAEKSKAKDYLGAIESFKKCVEIYEELEDGDNDNAVTASGQIPNMQYKYAISLYKQKKYDESIAAFGKLKEYAETYNDPKNAKKAKATVPKLYYAKGVSLLKSKKYEEALASFDKSIELIPKYPMVYVRKAQVYKEQKDEANFKAAVDMAITTAVAKKDKKSEATAKKIASGFYLKAGAVAVKAEKYAVAEKHFNTSMEYKAANSDLYYQLAVIYNKQSKWDAGIKSAKKALELFKPKGTTKDAKIYYELGTAFHGKGDKASACDAFSKAKKGDYAEAAEYQMKHVVKCL